MTTKLEQLSTWLADQSIDFGFIQSKANVFYLSNVYCEPHERLIGIGVFPDNEAFFICPKMEVGIVRNAGWKGEIYSYNDSENPWKLLETAVLTRKNTISSCAVETNHITYERILLLQESFRSVAFTSIESCVNELRLIKTNEEQQVMQEAARLADFGVEVGVHALSTGRNEMDIVALIEYELKKKGVREMSFSTLVLSGPNASDPHGKPGIREIQKGDLVLFDLGVVLDGYCSDITRTVAYYEITEEQKMMYDAVLHAQKEALTLCKPGTVIKDLDIHPRTLITNAGYGEYFPHRIGHGLGIDVHEFPSLHSNNDTVLKAGMCLTIEPGIYIPNLGGVRIEDDVLITSTGHQCLTTYPKELQIIKT